MKHTLSVWNQDAWSPFRLATGFDRLWDELAGEAKTQVRAFTPACDVEETETHFLVSLDVPGVPKDAIKLELKDRQLLISGERKQERTEKSEGRVFTEKTYGSFQRAFELGDSVDASKIEAAYKDGVLKVLIPKAEETKPRTISVKDGEKAGFFEKLLAKKQDEEKEIH